MDVLLCLLRKMIEVGGKHLLLNMCFAVLNYFDWKQIELVADC